MSQPICYKCKDRKVGCHADCKRYAEWKINHINERRETRRTELALETRWNYGMRYYK